MELVLAFAGVAVTIGIAWWQHHRAARAERRLNDLIQDLPRQLATQLQRLAPAQVNGPDDATPRRLLGVSYADVDNDGHSEVLVQHSVGAHGSAVDVFAFRDDQFLWIGGLNVGTGAGFEVADFDGDGLLEIGTQETDWSTDLPYYLAPREQIWYRWAGDGFAEVARSKAYTPDELKNLKLQAEEP